MQRRPPRDRAKELGETAARMASMKESDWRHRSPASTLTLEEIRKRMIQIRDTWVETSPGVWNNAGSAHCANFADLFLAKSKRIRQGSSVNRFRT